jgi:hypothetical protein
VQAIKIDRFDTRLVPFFYQKRQALPILVQGLHDWNHPAIEVAVPLVGQANLLRTLFSLQLIEKSLALDRDLLFELIVA